MENIIAIINMELLNYRRNKLTYFMLVAFTFYIGIGYFHFLRQDSIDAGQMLQSSSYINMAAALFGLIFGVLMARREKSVHFQEVLQALPEKDLVPFGKLLAWLILSTIVTILAYLEVLTLFYVAKSEFLLFRGEILRYIIIYWGGILFVAGIVGYSLEILCPYRWNIVLVLLVWILVSPFNIFFFNFIPHPLVSGMLYIINAGEREISSAYHHYHGLNTTSINVMNYLMFLFFSLFILAITLLLKGRHEMKKSLKKVLIISIGICLILFTYTITPFIKPLDQSPYREYQQLYMEKDANHYNQGNLIDLEMQKINNLLIAISYDIVIAFEEGNIQYKSDVIVENSSNESIVPFTLYHGLEVSSVKINDKAIPFEREEDWLMIEWPEGVTREKVTFEVWGNTGAFSPITEGSVFLASSFPWYPIPGTWIVAEKVGDFYQPEFKNLQLQEPAKFHIVVEDKNQTFSNLDRIGINEFQGVSSGASLLQGMLLYSEIDGREYLTPPDRLDKLIEVIPSIEDKSKYIATILNFPEVPLPNKIYVKPSYSYFTKDVLFLVEDHLFVSSQHLNQLTIDQLTRTEGIFRALYWNNHYHQRNGLHAYFIEMIFEQLESPEISMVNWYASLDPSMYNEENLIFVDFSNELITLQNRGDQYLEELIRRVYHQLQTEDYPIEIWFDTIDELMEGGI